MFVQFLFLLLHMILIFSSIDIDLSSIRIDPDLYRLCWKQYSDTNYGKLTVTNKDSGKMEQLPIFKDTQTKDNAYCIEKKNKISSYWIDLPLWGLRKREHIYFYVTFSIPLTPGLLLIRKKILPNGVHFQLSLGFLGILNKSQMYCQIITIYGPNKTESVIISMNLEITEQQITLKPGTKFDCYYFCYIGGKSTEIVVDHGTVFPVEKNQPLQPFLQFPFTRFLVGQWRNPPNVTEIYQIEIYKFSASNIAECLKVFRLYSSSKPVDTSIKYPENCDKGIDTEDLGTVDLIDGRNVYVVLGMGVLLKKSSRYKMSIWWFRNASSRWEDNFIYFEPLPNENSGNIHSDIYNYDPSNYEKVRNKISDMWQNVIPQYSVNISSTKFLKLSKFDEILILPTVSSSPFKRLTSPKMISYDEVNEKCKEIPSCSNGFHPLFYVMLTNKSQTDNVVELLPIPLKESFYIDNLKSSSNYKNETFTITWEIPQNKSNIPSLFAIRLRWANNTCFALNVLLCRTCNKEHKEISETNFNESFSTMKRDCQRYERFDNYYGAMDSLITFQIKELVQDWIPRADMYSINLYETELLGNINKDNIKETFWRKYGTIVISLLCTIFGLALIIHSVMWLKLYIREMRNKSERYDQNIVHNDDEL